VVIQTSTITQKWVFQCVYAALITYLTTLAWARGNIAHVILTTKKETFSIRFCLHLKFCVLPKLAHKRADRNEGFSFKSPWAGLRTWPVHVRTRVSDSVCLAVKLVALEGAKTRFLGFVLLQNDLLKYSHVLTIRLSCRSFVASFSVACCNLVSKVSLFLPWERGWVRYVEYTGNYKVEFVRFLSRTFLKN